MGQELSEQLALVVGVKGDVREGIARRLSADGAVVSTCDFESPVSHASHGIKAFLEKHGRIDILVTILPESPALAIDELTAPQVEAALKSVSEPSFLLMQAALVPMRKQRYGRIVHVSRLEYLGAGMHSMTALTHASIFGLTRAAALEVAKSNIMVNNVVVGALEPGAGASQDEVEKAVANIPVKRAGRPSDVGYAVSYFANRAQKYVTGQTLFVCGGKSALFSMSV